MSLAFRFVIGVSVALMLVQLGRYSGLDTGAESSSDEVPVTVTGRPRVRDGDSLDFARVRVRLFGIDAFELGQRCLGRDGLSVSCGHSAKIALENLVRGASVTCERYDVDTYGRMVAVCKVGDRDLAASLVSDGLALAYRRYSRVYVGLEKAAKAAGRGAWSGSFDAPWDWRESQRRSKSP